MDSQESESVIHFKGVSKRRGSVCVLDNLSFDVRRSEVICLLGVNGAGKSTAILHLLGQMAPDSGTVTVLGSSPGEFKNRRRLGCTPQDSGFPHHVTVEEILALVAAHYPNPSTVDLALETFGLRSLRHRQAGTLSGGQRRCLTLACAFIGNPEVVVLDEPTTGVDVDIRHQLWKSVRDYSARGGTVVFTTHYLEEAEELATRVVVIHQGRAIKTGDIASIKSTLGLKKISFFSPETVTSSIPAEIERIGSQYTVWTSHADDFVQELSRNHGYRDLEVRSLKLEEAFLRILHGDAP